MLTFFISFIVAVLTHRAWLRSGAIGMAILFGLIHGFSAYEHLDPKVLALPDQSGVYFYVLTTVALSVAEVVAAFLLAWWLRRLFSSRKKGNQ